MATTPTKEGVSPHRRKKPNQEEEIAKILTKSEIKVQSYKEHIEKKLEEEFP
jgi:hypothetical protein